MKSNTKTDPSRSPGDPATNPPDPNQDPAQNPKDPCIKSPINPEKNNDLRNENN